MKSSNPTTPSVYIYFLLAIALITGGFIAFRSGGQEPIGPSGVAEIRFGNFSTFSNESGNGNASVYIKLNDVVVVNNFNYGFVTPLIGRDADTYRVEVFSVETNELLYFRIIELASDQDYTFLLVGDNDTKPVEAVFLEDSLVEPITNGGQVRILHFAQLTPGGGNSQVDIRDEGDNVVANDLEYGYRDDSFSLFLSSGTTRLTVTTSNGGNVLLDPREFDLENGDLGTYLLVGNVKNDTVGVYFFKNDTAGGFITDFGQFELPPSTFSFANLGIIRESADDPAIPLRIELNGEPFSEETVYGDYIAEQEIDAGESLFEVFRKDDETKLISKPVDFLIGDEMVLVFAGNGDSIPYVLEIVSQGEFKTSDDLPQIRFGHFSSFADQQNGRIDVTLETGQIMADDLTFGLVDGARKTISGDFRFNIADWDGSNIYFQMDPVTILSQSDVTLLLTGDQQREPIAFFKIDNDEARFIPTADGGPAIGNGTLTVSNLSLKGLESNPVTMRLNGEIVATQIFYGASIDPIQVGVGQHFVEIVDSISGTILASQLVSVGYSTQNNLFFVGEGSLASPYTLALVDAPESVNRGSSLLQLGNYAEVNGQSDDGSIRFVLNGDPVPASDPSVGNGPIESTTMLLPGGYRIEVLSTADGSILIDEHLLNLSDGSVWYVVTTGDGLDYPYRLYAVGGGEGGQFLLPAAYENLTNHYIFPLVGND